MDFSVKDWITLLSNEYAPSKERVIFTSRFRKAMRIRKDVWTQFFAGYDGVSFQAGDEIRLVAANEGDAKFTLPDWTITQLDLDKNDTICITQRDGECYIKKLTLVQRPTHIPGHIVIDTFDTNTVTRTYTNYSVVDDIQISDLQDWLSQMGTLHHNPLAPFQKLNGFLGLQARQILLDELSADDKAAAQTFRQKITNAQNDDGSWSGEVLTTASNIIRLLDMGEAPKNARVQKGAHWLLSLPEPVGLPGLFLVSTKLTERFNQWKSKPGAKGRPHRRESKGELRTYHNNVDFITQCAFDACELRLTWTSALVLEALLRSGFHDDARVIRAINTLFGISGHGGWCGCGYLDARVNQQALQTPPDFNRFTVAQKNSQHHLDWFPELNDIVGLSGEEQYTTFDAHNGKALWVKFWHNTGLCTMVMHHALSYHPDYAGSTLESMGALRISFCQSAIGTWGTTVYRASMLGFLSRYTHPLAAFLVLRSVPSLIRTQQPDGLWQESPIQDSGQDFPIPTKEASSLLILKALKAFGYLDILWPHS